MRHPLLPPLFLLLGTSLMECVYVFHSLRNNEGGYRTNINVIKLGADLLLVPHSSLTYFSSRSRSRRSNSPKESQINCNISTEFFVGHSGSDIKYIVDTKE